MQIFKPFIFNIYTLLFNALRLTFLALVMTVCLSLISCDQNVKNLSLANENKAKISEKALNINSASALELQKLPRIGEELAQRIIHHRENFGKFRRTEELILVKGISDKKFRELRDLVKVE